MKGLKSIKWANSDSSKIVNIGIIILALLPLVYWVILKLNQDAWWDEIVSLNTYALAGFKTLTTYYPDPNNHIFFNLINSILALVFSDSNIVDALNHLWIYRALQLIFALLQILVLHKLLNRMGFGRSGALAITILVTTVPFLNYSLQLRGYMLSQLLALAVFYFQYSYIKLAVKGYLVALSLCLIALLYTLPSNVYITIALYISIYFYLDIISIKGLISFRKKEGTEIVFWSINITYIVSVLIAFTLYLPVIEQILSNRFTNQVISEPLRLLTTLMPEVLLFFLSNRWLLITITGLLIILWLWKRILYSRSEKAIFFAALVILFLPFVLATIHGVNPPQRAFLPGLPFFVILISLSVEKFTMHYRHVINDNISTLIIVMVCLLTAFFEMHKNESRLTANAINGVKSQNIYLNYYLSSHFQPNNVAERLAQYNDDIPAVLVNDFDRVASSFYLGAHGIDPTAIMSVQKKKSTFRGKEYDYVVSLELLKKSTMELEYRGLPFDRKLGDPDNAFSILQLINAVFNKGQEFFIITNMNGSNRLAIQQVPQLELFPIVEEPITSAYLATP